MVVVAGPRSEAAAMPPGAWVDTLLSDLQPLCRSITGDGNRATLERIAGEIELEVIEVPSGTPVLDWTVPREWNLERATLHGPDGEVLADTWRSNLHLVGYSRAISARLSLEDLSPHLHSTALLSGAIPYRTAYYADTWGFCLAGEVSARLEPGSYEVDIRTSIRPGSLTYGQLVVPGSSDREVLVSTHICHPSMADDNLSGIAATVAIARWAMAEPRRRAYRFLFAPATIGSITWLATNADVVDRIVHGLVVTGVGDRGPLTYKRSRRGDTATDRAMAAALGESGSVIDWYPYGYDERQFCSPGFELPMGRLSRSLHGTYPQYHTSHDDLDFVSTERILEAAAVAADAFALLDRRRQPANLSPRGEPQLGRRGLFADIGGTLTSTSPESAYLWLLSLADGDRDLCEISERSGLSLAQVEAGAERLRAVGLLGPD